MKIHKLPSKDKNNFSIDRKFLSKIGDSIYFNPEVSGISIKVKFRDKTKLEYTRHHVIDEIEADLEQEERNSECKEGDD
jgi:hypothetical protein